MEDDPADVAQTHVGREPGRGLNSFGDHGARSVRSRGLKESIMTQVVTRTWTEVRPARKTAIPEGLWLRCPSCGQMIYRKQMEANLHVCPECNHHYRINATERVKQLADTGTFQAMFTGLAPSDPLGFKDLKPYAERLLAE